MKKQIAASFIGAWVAINYQQACSSGNHEMLNEPPVEDAEYMAEEAMKYWKRVGKW